MKNVYCLDIMPRMKKGKIIPNGVVLKNHENATVVFLTELGFDVELIPKIITKSGRVLDLRK